MITVTTWDGDHNSSVLSFIITFICWWCLRITQHPSRQLDQQDTGTALADIDKEKNTLLA